MEKYYYKVVKIKKDKCVSALQWDDSIIEYDLNQWVYPKFGHIFIFSDIKSAKKFKNSYNVNGVLRILKVKADVVFKAINDDFEETYPIGTRLTNRVYPLEFVD